MPYKSEKIIIKGSKFDRRIKLTPEDKEEIRRLYKTVKSQRKLAAMYGVSRRLITFVLEPKRLETNYKNRLSRGGSKQYYDKDEWKKTMKEHRNYKEKLHKEGKI